MKKVTIIGLLIIGLIFQNCKNNKKNKDILKDNDTITVVQEDIDTAKFFENLETDKEILSVIESKETKKPTIESPESIEKEVIKSTDETIATINKEEAVKKEIVTEDVVEVTKTAKEIVKEEETKTETGPIAEKVIKKKTEAEIVIIDEQPKTEVTANKWVVPAKYQTMKNPTDPMEDVAIGKSLYRKHCKSCHGSKGYGDGPKANEMKGDLGDFSTKEFQAQSDGALFYKTSLGRDDMPRFNKKIADDEDRWLIVNYLRTLEDE